MVEFAGWDMPLLYASIVEEHRHTRAVGSIFDVSHMGRIDLRGAEAENLLERVCTRRLADADVGRCRYSHVCNEQGGILDDVIVCRCDTHWLMVCNASNREKILSWLQRHGEGMDVAITDMTEVTLMVAVQGPDAIETLAALLPVPIKDLKRYHARTGRFMGAAYTVCRTGYTGEDGIELIVPAAIAPLAVNFLQTATSADGGLKPAGLGARDTLRLEAAMPLYGHELHEQVDPLSAGQAWCVDLEKEFIGADALRTLARRGPGRQLVGLELEGQRIARPPAAVFDADEAVGEVTSGTSSPTLNRSIALAYVPPSLAEPGQELAVGLGRKRVDATVVRLPFYKRTRTAKGGS